MKFLSHFNPANHLYIKLFLWFWLATIIMMSSSMWIIKQLDENVRFKPVRQSQLSEVDEYTQKLQAIIDSRAELGNIENTLVQIGMRNQIGLILVEPQNNEVISGLPRHMQPDKTSFTSISPDTPMISVDTGEGTFWGPGLVHYKNMNYMLFVGRPKPPGFVGSIRRQHPSIMFSIALCISGLLCFWFARSLVNPIQQLQEASKQMATGNLAIRVGSASKRRDEIGRLGRDFNFMSEQVERLMGSQKRLLADISHELRSPLARLQLSIGILQQKSEGNEDEHLDKGFLLSSISRIEKEAAQIEKMIAQVLTLSRLDNPQSILHKQVIDIQLLISPIISDARFEAQEQNKQVVFDNSVSYFIEGDVQMLSSAIENVLRNAVNYAANKVLVSIDVQQEGCLLLTILDDGKGIDEGQLSRIFEPFYRESLARDRASGGVGLGLAIAYQAILQHQGTIQASNTHEGGLQVSITLPLVKMKSDIELTSGLN